MPDFQRITKLEGRVDNIEKVTNSMEHDITDIRDDLKHISNDVGAIREILAEQRGAGAAIKYLTHASAGIIGAVGAFLGVHK